MKLAAQKTQTATAPTDAPQYLYCILRSKEALTFEARGMGLRGDLVHSVNYKDIAAIVSDSPEPDYDNSRRNMMTHMRVLEEVMWEHTILPIRFNGIAPDTRAVRERLLEARYGELCTLLDDMEGRTEMGLKAFWHQDVVLQEMLEQNSEIRALRDSLSRRSAEESYFERVRLGEMVEAELKARRGADAEQLLDRLRPLADKIKVNDAPLDSMVLNAAFLLAHAKEPAFSAAVSTIDAELGQRFLLKCVGPVPPYNFVNVSLRWKE